LSRIGKNPIPIPQEVKVDIQGNRVSIEGPKGKLSRELRPEIKVSLKDKEIVVERTSNRRFDRSLHGLSRTLIANMVKGVTQGYNRVLEIKGIGYKAEIKGKILSLSLGFSLPILFVPPDGIKIELEGPTKIVVWGINKELVGLVASHIRSFRPPDTYKGKGIRYQEEKVRKKAGKTAV
jgi:large subunit ribosomal protein L6